MKPDEVRYFTDAAQMRTWLRRHHRKQQEVFVGFFKRHSGQAGLTWPESVAEALCFGWIDGVRRTIDGDRYAIRFTPRKSGSTWSAVNIRMVAELEAAGRMTDAGRTAFAARQAKKSRTYSYEQDEVSLDAARLRTFKSNKAAWAYFSVQPPGYQRKAVWWVMSAKQDLVKDRRFDRLLQSSSQRKRLG